MLKPLNNHLLVEVTDPYEGLRQDTSSESLQEGIVRDYTLINTHITMSTGYTLPNMSDFGEFLNSMIGKTVYWQEHADAGQKFVRDGKTYALIPFWRLIAFEDEDKVNVAEKAARVEAQG